MANTIRIKRRSSSGSAGVSGVTAYNGELLYNEADNILYYGYGDAGGGVASSITAIAGAGAYAGLSANNTFSGTISFTNTSVTFANGFTLPLNRGGTGASTASGARTNLGLGTIATQDASSVSITGGTITGITDLAIADGGTGASTAADARTNLGLGTIATQAASNVSITGGSITGITDLAVADGGTGASTAASARSNLGAAASGANSDITSITGLTTALTVAQGGTGSTTASGARTNLSAAASGANSDITSITGLTTALSVAQGGTGGTTAAAARTNLLPSFTGAGGKYLAVNSGATDIEYVTATSGTVTSVSLTVPTSVLSVSGSPITSSGTLAVSLANQSANVIFAGPTTGAATTPTFRALVAADIPALSYLSSSGGTVSGNVIVTGNLTVQGTTTTVSSTTLTVADKNIELATGSSTDAAADGGGITLHGATDKYLNWVDATDSWTSSEHIDLASGKAFKINGTTVLNATTLDGVAVDGGTF
jgi:hypothetical protein